MKNNLKHLVLKPTLKCTSNCPTCSLRLDLFKDKQSEKVLSLTKWREVISQAKYLGCKNLHISGGEPLLYNKLIDLIDIGTSNGLTVNLNTNGSLINDKNASQMKHARLTSATVSIYSQKSIIHDQYRGDYGLYDRAINSIDILVKNKITVYLQTILTNYNIDNFEKIIELAYYHKANYMVVSYLEGDIEKKWLPTVNQIVNFKDYLIPIIYNIIDSKFERSSGFIAKQKLSRMFKGNAKTAEDFSNGEYFKAGKPYCSRPNNFALVLSNGDVLPCNGVEYFHTPIIGNINDNDLVEIWNSDAWNKFRQERHEWCQLCPMTLHFNFPIHGVPQ